MHSNTTTRVLVCIVVRERNAQNIMILSYLIRESMKNLYVLYELVVVIEIN